MELSGSQIEDAILAQIFILKQRRQKLDLVLMRPDVFNTLKRYTHSKYVHPNYCNGCNDPDMFIFAGEAFKILPTIGCNDLPIMYYSKIDLDGA